MDAVFVELPPFEQHRSEYLDDTTYSDFQQELMKNPEAGDVIPGSGGYRKVRWSLSGRGKRGGSRIIYFNQLADGEIWLLVIYSKSVRGNIPAHLLKAVREAIESE